MNKVLTYRSIREGGEPTVYVADDRHIKTASVCPDLLSALGDLESPEEDMVRTVVTALSAFEGFGANRNGDGFHEKHLLRKNDYSDIVGEALSVPMYRSFEHFARPYKYHVNRPDSPAYGRVIRSVYNPSMKRVELIVEVDRSKAPEIVRKIENYEPVATSMGFRCMKGGDVCSICGNLAKSRAHYCDHLKKKMLKTMPDGRLVYAINPYGRFFDISFVDDPADQTSRAVWVDQLPLQMQEAEEEIKEASFFRGDALSADLAVMLYGENAEPRVVSEKLASSKMAADKLSSDKLSADKQANPIKRIGADIELRPEEVEMYRKAVRRMRGERLSKEALRVLSQYGLKTAAATTMAAGIDLYPEEAQFIALAEEFPKTAEHLYDGRVVLDLSGVNPAPHMKKAAIGPDDVDEDVLRVFASTPGLLEKRSMYRPWLLRGLEKRANNPFIAPDHQMSSEEMLRALPEKERMVRQPREDDLADEAPAPRTAEDSLKEKMGIMASFLLGARLLAQGPESLIEQYPELATLLAGGRAATEMNRAAKDFDDRNAMPMTRRRRRRLLREKAGPSPSEELMNSPMAFQMMMGMPYMHGMPAGGGEEPISVADVSGFDSGSEPPIRTDGAGYEGAVLTGDDVLGMGVMTRSMAQNKQASRRAAQVLRKSDVSGYSKTASRLSITPEVSEYYAPHVIDADLVCRYAGLDKS